MKLSKCIKCKEQRYIMYIRNGKINESNKNRALSRVGYNYCPSCDTTFKDNGEIFIEKISNIEKKLKEEFDILLNALKLDAANKEDISVDYLYLLKNLHKHINNVVVRIFED